MSVHELQQERASLSEVAVPDGIPLVRKLRTPAGEITVERDYAIGERITASVTLDGRQVEVAIKVYEERTKVFERDGEPTWARRIFFTTRVDR